MNVVEKKIWPEFFNKIKKNEQNVELRINDFILNPGDVLVLREYNPVTKEYTGRKVTRKVKIVHGIDISKFYKLDQVKKKGLLLIELGQKV